MSVEDQIAAVLDAEIERLTKLRNQLRTGTPAKQSSGNGRRKKRRGKMSPEGRAAIAAAQRKRWAAKRAEANPVEQEVNQPAKRGRKKK